MPISISRVCVCIKNNGSVKISSTSGTFTSVTNTVLYL